MKGRVALWIWRAVLVVVAASIVVAGIAPTDKLVVLYVVGALWMRLGSEWSFGIALIFLIATPIMQNVGQRASAETYPVYAFYFLVIGAVQALTENFRAEGLEPSKNRTKKEATAIPQYPLPAQPRIVTRPNADFAKASASAAISSDNVWRPMSPRVARANGLRPEVAPRRGGPLVRF